MRRLKKFVKSIEVKLRSKMSHWPKISHRYAFALRMPSWTNTITTKKKVLLLHTLVSLNKWNPPIYFSNNNCVLDDCSLVCILWCFKISYLINEHVCGERKEKGFLFINQVFVKIVDTKYFKHWPDSLAWYMEIQ